MIKRYLAILWTMLLPSILFAAQPGFYIGAGIGQAVGPEQVIIKNSDFNHQTNGTITGQNADVYSFSTRNSTIYHLLGGYTFNPYFGLEITYSYLGKQGLTSFSSGITKNLGFEGTLESYFYGITGVGHASLKQIDLFAKAGLGMVHSKATISDPNGVVYVNPGKYQLSTNDYAIVYGAGASYTFMRNLALSVEWNRISRFNDDKIGNVSYNQFLLNLIYSFPMC